MEEQLGETEEMNQKQSDNKDNESSVVEPEVNEQIPDLNDDNDDEANDDNDISAVKKKTRLIVSDSEDSDNDNVDKNNEERVENEIDPFEPEKPTQKSKFKLIDSDTDSSDNEITDKTSEESAQSLPIEAPIYTLNNRQELVPEKSMTDGLAALCDPDTSDEEEHIQPLPYRKKSGKKDAAEPGNNEKRMTGKEAHEQRKEIDSESQRMQRDSQVALPYHKPKQRTLKEFLQMRSRFASSVPHEVKSIKMNNEQLQWVSKKIEEREKLVKEFYKSDSEEDEEQEQEVKDNETEESTGDKVQNGLETVENKDNETENMENSECIEKSTELNEVSTDIQTNNEDLSNILVEKVVNEVQIGKSTENQAIEESEDLISLNKAAESDETQTKGKDKEKSFEYDFNLDDSDCDQDEIIQTSPAASSTELHNQHQEQSEVDILQLKPKLSGAPNCVIDLETGIIAPDEIATLMQRFAQHTAPKLSHKPIDIETSIVCVTQGGNIHREKVVVHADNAEAPPIEEKPGVKFQQLRQDLRAQMAERRNTAWIEKQKQLEEQKRLEQEEDEVYKGEKETCIDALLDMEDEEDFSDEASSNDGDDEDYEEEIDYDDEEEAELLKLGGKSLAKQHKRIIQPVESDSDSDFDNNDDETAQSRTTHLDSTISLPGDEDDEFVMPAGQTNTCRTPIKQLYTQQNNTDLGFLSPVCRLTGLQSFDSTGKFLQNSPGSPVIKLTSNETETSQVSPLRQTGWAKSLFVPSPLKETLPTQEEEALTTQDMLALCSGNFTGISQQIALEDQTDMEQSELMQSEENCDEDEVVKEYSPKVVNVVKEIAIDEADECLISQLIDEEELENFKKKFESPVVEQASQSRLASAVVAANLRFDQEDDDSSSDDEEYEISMKRSKHTNIMLDSDDSDQEELENVNEAPESPEITDDKPDEDDTEIGYDSEENEIVVEKDKKEKPKFHLNNFVEHEAELSESDWGSADEDEQQLDQLEMEEGDLEQFDQRKMRRDLEKIRMKQMLDADKKDLKVLKELYMDEDEELQGAGRQRQFRWRNIDSAGTDEAETSRNEENALNEDGEDENENEEEWRKRRFEREVFLQSQKDMQKKQTSVHEEDATATDSQIFKLGKRAVIKNITTVRRDTEKTKVVTKQAYRINTQRGSFLTRSDEVLSRVAEYTKVSEAIGGASKSTRNFVFQTVASNANTNSEAAVDDKKRKAGDAGTPMQLKRLRLNGFSPAAEPKMVERRTKARLFNTNSR